MGGEDEMEMIKDLPEGLRRDIKRHLCLDLIRKASNVHMKEVRESMPHYVGWYS